MPKQGSLKIWTEHFTKPHFMKLQFRDFGRNEGGPKESSLGIDLATLDLFAPDPFKIMLLKGGSL